MSNLIQISKMTSMEISEATGKQHGHIMRDIKDEIEKLESAGISIESKFGLNERKDSIGRTVPYYELTREGVLQIAARYDAVSRAKLIDLAMKVEQQNSINLSNLSKELQAILFMDDKVQYIESRVDKLENTMTIDYSQQEELRTAANKKVLFTLGGKDTMAYKRVGKKAFAGLYRDIKQAFSVNSYKNIAVVDMDKAKRYIANWLPDEELGLMIDGANARSKELAPV